MTPAHVLAAVTVLLVAGSAKGWVLIGPPDAYSFRLDSLEKHGGRSSGLLECTDQDVQEFGSILQTIRADGYRNERVRLAAYVRTRGVEESARLWMRVDGPESSGIAFDNMTKRAFRGDTEWSRYDIVLDVPAEVVQIGFGAILGGKGRFWIDDLVLEPVTRDVPTTDMHAPPVPAKAVVPPGLPLHPVDADFEE